MKVLEVTTPGLSKDFFEFPARLYKNSFYWVHPLNADIKNVFNPRTNPTFQHGELSRFIVKNEQSQTLGRVAVFVNEKTKLKDNDQPTGGIGYFECVDNKQVAFLLFDTCKEWLQQRGCEAMDGPINFGNRDKFWGLLVEGFDKLPNYQQNYHMPYYRAFFEEYGFQVYFEQYTYYRTIGYAGQKTTQKAERIFSNPSYQFKYFDFKNIDKFTKDFCKVYNASFALTEGLPELTQQEAEAIIHQLKPIMDERLVIFAYYEDTPIGFGVFIPELNQFLKSVQGNFNLWNKIKFLYRLHTSKKKKILGIVFGIATRFHGRGIDAAITIMLEKQVTQPNFPYYDIELNWIGDFNPPMHKMAEGLGFEIVKKHHTYRKLFNTSQPFKRHPVRSYQKKE